MATLTASYEAGPRLAAPLVLLHFDTVAGTARQGYRLRLSRSSFYDLLTSSTNVCGERAARDADAFQQADSRSPQAPMSVLRASYCKSFFCGVTERCLATLIIVPDRLARLSATLFPVSSWGSDFLEWF